MILATGRERERDFFLKDTTTAEIYTLSLHDALPIFASGGALGQDAGGVWHFQMNAARGIAFLADRKSTRLNSSHSQNSYAVFCLKKKMELELERRCKGGASR